MSGRYLFVNRRGLKVADYAPQELACSFADGRPACWQPMRFSIARWMPSSAA